MRYPSTYIHATTSLLVAVWFAISKGHSSSANKVIAFIHPGFDDGAHANIGEANEKPTWFVDNAALMSMVSSSHAPSSDLARIYVGRFSEVLIKGRVGAHKVLGVLETGDLEFTGRKCPFKDFKLAASAVDRLFHWRAFLSATVTFATSTRVLEFDYDYEPAAEGVGAEEEATPVAAAAAAAVHDAAAHAAAAAATTALLATQLLLATTAEAAASGAGANPTIVSAAGRMVEPFFTHMSVDCAAKSAAESAATPADDEQRVYTKKRQRVEAGTPLPAHYRKTSKWRGVSWKTRDQRWVVNIGLPNGKKKRYLGAFKEEDDAARAYDAAAMQEKLNISQLNFPAGDTRDPIDAAALPRKSSKWRGVTWDTREQRWQAQIHGPNRKNKYLGRFKEEDDAARAYDAAAMQKGLDNSQLNFPAEDTTTSTTLNRNRRTGFTTYTKYTKYI
jgi:hypothetical protein